MNYVAAALVLKFHPREDTARKKFNEVMLQFSGFWHLDLAISSSYKLISACEFMRFHVISWLMRGECDFIQV